MLIGTWAVRQPLHDRGTQGRLLVTASAVALTQPLVAAAHAVTGWTFLNSVAHSNQTAWYVLASATAVAVVAACLLAARVARPIVPLGQMALSAYLAHLFLGEVVVFPWRDAGDPSLATQVTVAGLVFAAFAVAASAWLATHRRGPVETVVRTLAR